MQFINLFTNTSKKQQHDNTKPMLLHNQWTNPTSLWVIHWIFHKLNIDIGNEQVISLFKANKKKQQQQRHST